MGKEIAICLYQPDEKARTKHGGSERLMNAVQGYAKGKKSVRTFQSGKDKFSNYIDALGVWKESFFLLVDVKNSCYNRKKV